MTRKHLDTQPSIIIWPLMAGSVAPAEAEGIAKAIAELVRVHVVPQLWQVPGLSRLTSRQCDIEIKLEDDFRCGHCNSFWTKTSADFNGGCCGPDEASDPVRLASIRAAAHVLKGVAFFAIDESGGQSGVAISWPNTLAVAAVNWLDAGRPAGCASVLRFAIKRVRDGEWGSIRTDPCPLDAAVAGVRDGVARDRRPDNLACALLELMDDMGLLTAISPAKGAR